MKTDVSHPPCLHPVDSSQLIPPSCRQQGDLVEGGACFLQRLSRAFLSRWPNRHRTFGRMVTREKTTMWKRKEKRASSTAVDKDLHNNERGNKESSSAVPRISSAKRFVLVCDQLFNASSHACFCCLLTAKTSNRKRGHLLQTIPFDYKGAFLKPMSKDIWYFSFQEEKKEY